jgi:hypothetical protein
MGYDSPTPCAAGPLPATPGVMDLQVSLDRPTVRVYGDRHSTIATIRSRGFAADLVPRGFAGWMHRAEPAKRTTRPGCVPMRCGNGQRGDSERYAYDSPFSCLGVRVGDTHPHQERITDVICRTQRCQGRGHNHFRNASVPICFNDNTRAMAFERRLMRDSTTLYPRLLEESTQAPTGPRAHQFHARCRMA